MKILTVAGLCLLSLTSIAQDYRWQQKVEYTMNVALNNETNILNGTQKLVYYNNSPDTLTKVYYHLFFNAFQPGSMMDVRSGTISDPDRRIGTRISKLTESETGYQRISNMKQDGKSLKTTVDGTILIVELAKPLLPKSKTVFEMSFEAQVPIQIRRSGRNSAEGIAYSMTQWYPKIAEYDYQGWHAYQYVAREFHGVWGDFDVTIAIDSSFTVAGTGVLQDADKIGHGYGKEGSKPLRKARDLKWRFVAKNVIDFAWAADPDYVHDKIRVPNGPEVHFFYQPNEKTSTTWKNLQPFVAKVFQHMNETFGKYPYDTYSVIQGGDGGMEYPMCTLILGEGKFEGLAGTAAHEIAHSWYQMVLASNEALNAWMDEGFADFSSDETIAAITQTRNDHAGSYRNYFAVVANGLLEVPNQHSDHFASNRGYKTGSYTTGALFLNQLKYIMGEQVFYPAMRRYYNTWKFRHPEPNDFMRIMEKSSGLQLHWFMRYWINSNKKIDYQVKEVTVDGDQTNITLARVGEIPMPIDLLVTMKDGSKQMIYIPLNEMLGGKPNEIPSMERTTLPEWRWVDQAYTAKVNKHLSDIASIEIDPSMRMADIDRANNKWENAAPQEGN
jgi:hypothetical protein